VRKFGYVLVGNLTSKTDANGFTVTHGYDGLNRRKTVTAAGGTIETVYDRTSLPVEVRYPNGVVSSTVYDRAMRVRSIQHAKAGVALETFDYAYDFNGNRTGQTRRAGGLTETTTYRYDDDDRLTYSALVRTDGSSQTIDYVLDAVGNRKTETSVATGPNHDSIGIWSERCESR
jgi:YD repeat-containing protein